MKRSRQKEMMDLPGNPVKVLEEDLRNLRRINRYLGAYRGVLRGLAHFVDGKQLSAFSLLDVGTGGGDVPVAVARWARHKGVAAKIVALEPNPVTVGIARAHALGFPEISVVRGDGIFPPFSHASFDFVLASQLLHHFSEDEILALLRIWSRLARRGILISDLIRHPLAYCGIYLLTRVFTRNEMTRTDAPLSVRRAFTVPEWREIFEQSRIGEFRLFPLFPFRLLTFFPLGDGSGAV